MLIREELSEDIMSISRIQYAAFKGHPQHAPGAEPVEHLIVDRLRDSGTLSLSLVVEVFDVSEMSEASAEFEETTKSEKSEGCKESKELVGHIAFSPAVVGENSSGWYLLGPVGILPAYQKSGIGSQLIQEGLRQMQNMGATGIVLVGDPAFYTRFGFRSFPGLKYQGVPDQYVLGLSFSGDHPEGYIVANEAFSG